jgi:peptidyl-dipeptidase Dcp
MRDKENDKVSDLDLELEPWDWRYYAEKIRQTRYDLDAAELKPYFSLPRMTEAIFDCAHRLFGLKFVPRPDLISYHPDVQTYEVRETGPDGVEFLRAIFLHDNFSRSNKQGGAWMSEYRSQCRNLSSGDLSSSSTAVRTDSQGRQTIIPVIANNNNFSKAPDGHPTLLSFDDAVTLFHEFGHGLHGMLSDVTYQRLAGTSVLRDFVELPSQLFEHWLSQPEVLRKYARHHETNEAIPDELIARLKASQCFNNGFDTVEYLSSALVDQSLHKQVTIPADFDVSVFEKKELERLSMPAGMLMRHRPTHFLHLFSCSSYASAYYVYLWAEVLDADGFDAFLEKGGWCFIFTTLTVAVNVNFNCSDSSLCVIEIRTDIRVYLFI